MPRQLILGEAKDHKKSTAEVLSTFDGAKVLLNEKTIGISPVEELGISVELSYNFGIIFQKYKTHYQ